MNRIRKPRQKTSPFGRKIILSIIIILIILIISVFFMGHSYLNASLKPLNSNDHKTVQINVPMGASNRKIGSILQNQNIVRSGMVFDYYVKAHNISDFRAGYYELAPSMSLKKIAGILRKGGTSFPTQRDHGKITVKHGMNIDQLASTIQINSHFSSQNFINLMKNRKFVNHLKQKYPKLLTDTMKSKNSRYLLEGYLYPSTYSFNNKTTLNQLVIMMISKEDMMLKPYYPSIRKHHLSIHKLLIIASLIDKQNLHDQNDKEIVSGILLNRIDNKMHLNSNVSVLYSIHKFKRDLSYKDLRNKSPYNLYNHLGLGPGPFNNPGLNSIKAALHPVMRKKGYLYFIVNPKNGKLLLAKNEITQKQNSVKMSQYNKK